ncbi:MAG: protoheme IX farnesyltransferase [Acidobacteria bacterium]|nr:protoheme IX farnesyltransferase [Acidobacteriota bacterium]
MAQATPYQATVERAAARNRTADFLTLTKPRLNSLVLVTTLAAYYLGDGHLQSWTHLFHTIVGTALVAGGASALNQLWERDTDRLMRRTRLRPLPDGRMQPGEAKWFGIGLGTVGIAELGLAVNPLTALVAGITLASYVFLYTPLKLRTSLSTIVGAIPGALPAVIGWAAATNSLSAAGWVLFGIVFMWQMPHFLAIAWLFRDDYAKAGFPLLPVIQPDGRTTGYQTVLYSAALIPISLLPTAVGIASAYHLVGAIALGAILMVLSVEFAVTRSMPAARRLFFGTILYLPLLWLVLLADHFTQAV